MQEILNIVNHKSKEPGNFKPRFLFTGGDYVPPSVLVQLQKTFPETNVIELYGPTEGTIIATSYHFNPDSASQANIIGRPLSNFTIAITEEIGLNTPRCVSGEICIGGDSVAEGYLNQVELTAEKFRHNVEHPEKSVYMTGDLGRWTLDGNIEFLGRKDDQVKIRGYRIEIGEIEAVMLKNESIRQVCVVMRKNEQQQSYLAAYFVTDGEDSEPRALRAHLASQLPEYMVPSYFIRLERLPVNSNGKVDKRNLPDPKQFHPAGQEKVAPATEVEKVLEEIWSTVLHQHAKDGFGINDNFFEVGGHSLGAMQIVQAIEERLNVKISLRKIFLLPTIETLAREVESLIAELNQEKIQLPDESEEFLI
jgi:acyl-coenzyme A synthetase/AMP-(fatty) acid ligase/acyl carrier protein